MKILRGVVIHEYTKSKELCDAYPTSDTIDFLKVEKEFYTKKEKLLGDEITYIWYSTYPKTVVRTAKNRKFSLVREGELRTFFKISRWNRGIRGERIWNSELVKQYSRFDKLLALEQLLHQRHNLDLNAQVAVCKRDEYVKMAYCVEMVFFRNLIF